MQSFKPIKDVETKEPEKKPKKIDTSSLDAVVNTKKQQVSTLLKREPSEMLEVDLRLREGSDYDGDTMEADGIIVKIPQISVIEHRRAYREALKTIDGTSLGKKIQIAMREESDDNRELGKLTFKEELDLGNIQDTMDLWLVFFTLKRASHSRITGEFSRDKDFIEMLPNFDLLAQKIRRVNGLNPEGADDLKSFQPD